MSFVDSLKLKTAVAPITVLLDTLVEMVAARFSANTHRGMSFVILEPTRNRREGNCP